MDGQSNPSSYSNEGVGNGFLSSTFDHPKSSKTEDHDVYDATMGETPVPGIASGSPSLGISHLFNVYSDKSSISGVPFIRNTKYTPVRIMWSILLFMAVVAMSLHLFKLCESFFEYDTQTKVDINFSSLQFPAVTFCNANAVRMSKLHLASDELRILVGNVKPEVLQELMDEWTASWDDEHFDDVDDLFFLFKKKRRKRSTNSSDERRVSVQHREGDFFGDLFGDNSMNTSSWYEEPVESFPNDEEFMDSWEAESSWSQFNAMEEQFTSLLSRENGLTRFEMGHQIRDMLISCSFSGRKCYQRNFTKSTSSVYGNCFTLDYDKFVSRQSGPRQGLELMVHLQTDEYIPTISNSKGIQLVIHEPNSLSFPGNEGFAVSAGTSTYIGLRKLEITRKDSPYGDCLSHKAFEEQYGILYTRQTCQRMCLQRLIRDECNCYDTTYLVLNRIMTIPQNLSGCFDPYQRECVYWRKYLFETEEIGCQCKSPCKESQFKKSISFRKWPSPAFTHVLVDTLCRDDPEVCPSLKNKTDSELQNEFLKVTIYFEDLNHETMEESPDYELFQFVSDIGGTVGLWIGLSVLSVFEIFHLGIAILRYVLCGNWRKKRKNDSWEPRDSTRM